MSEKKNETEATVLGLPQVHDDGLGTDPTVVPTPATTAPVLDQVTAPSLPPVLTPPAAPPRTRTGGVIPKAEVAPRRQSRVAQATPQDTVSTAEFSSPPAKDAFEWTMPRVAGIAGAVCFAFVLIWVFWPSEKAQRPVAQPTPAVEEPVAVVAPKPKPVEPVVAPVPAPPSKPTFRLDATTHVIDPFAAHLPDLDLDPAHKYRLRVERDDSHLGTALARLDEKAGWGVMRKMASHAALQFGGARALRLHCEPGRRFQDGQTIPLELLDLANKKKAALEVNPALHCWDFEVARLMELGEGVKKRVRVPTDSKLELGDRVTLRVAYILESLGEKKEWRTGVLDPGESVLAEGRTARFAILDAYAGDNEGTLDLEILSGDTQSSGLVTPSAAAGVEFVPAPK